MTNYGPHPLMVPTLIWGLESPFFISVCHRRALCGEMGGSGAEAFTGRALAGGGGSLVLKHWPEGEACFQTHCAAAGWQAGPAVSLSAVSLWSGDPPPPPEV